MELEDRFPDEAAEASWTRQEEEPPRRDPECVKLWPDCRSGGYDPRCCRFPKSCSCELIPTADQPPKGASE